MHNLLENNRKSIRELCKQLKVQRLYAFGSIVSGDFNDKSDVDFLLSFDSKISIKEYTDNYFSLHYKLQEIFNRKIDLVTERTLSNPYFIKSIEKSKQLIYEA
ncbi:MAG: nucleotidyltransferase domain-containing protein [Bacteroidota bacterium]